MADIPDILSSIPSDSARLPTPRTFRCTREVHAPSVLRTFAADSYRRDAVHWLRPCIDADVFVHVLNTFGADSYPTISFIVTW
jgi:hypothetical protein